MHVRCCKPTGSLSLYSEKTRVCDRLRSAVYNCAASCACNVVFFVINPLCCHAQDTPRCTVRSVLCMCLRICCVMVMQIKLKPCIIQWTGHALRVGRTNAYGPCCFLSSGQAATRPAAHLSLPPVNKRVNVTAASVAHGDR